MAGSVRQKTKIPYGSFTRVTNTYPRKRGKLSNVPPNSVVVFDKDFFRTDFKERMVRIKSSPKFKSEEAKLKSQLKNKKSVHLRRGENLTLRNKNVRIKIRTS